MAQSKYLGELDSPRKPYTRTEIEELYNDLAISVELQDVDDLKNKLERVRVAPSRINRLFGDIGGPIVKRFLEKHKMLIRKEAGGKFPNLRERSPEKFERLLAISAAPTGKFDRLKKPVKSEISNKELGRLLKSHKEATQEAEGIVRREKGEGTAIQGLNTRRRQSVRDFVLPDSFKMSDDLKLILRKLGRYGEQPSDIILKALRTKESLMAEIKKLRAVNDHLERQNETVVEVERQRKKLAEDKKSLIQYVKKLQAEMKLIGKEQEAYEKYIALLEGRPKR